MRHRRLGFAHHNTLFKTRPEIGTKNSQMATDQPLKFHGYQSSIRCRGRAFEHTATTVRFIVAWSFYPDLPSHRRMNSSHHWSMCYPLNLHNIQIKLLRNTKADAYMNPWWFVVILECRRWTSNLLFSLEFRILSERIRELQRMITEIGTITPFI